MGFVGRAFSVDDALGWVSGAIPSTEWLSLRPGRDVSGAQILNAIHQLSCRGSCIRNEELAGLEHRMQDHGQFARDSDGGSFERGNVNEAAFQLHQAAERLYHCVLLVLTLYSPKSHRLTLLRSHAERTDTRLIEVWPRDSRFAKRCFTRLDRAYVEARYSPHYEITAEELAWLVERVAVLQESVATICAERLNGSDPSVTDD